VLRVVQEVIREHSGEDGGGHKGAEQQEDKAALVAVSTPPAIINTQAECPIATRDDGVVLSQCSKVAGNLKFAIGAKKREV
jgi:hypothetical protein